MIFVAYGSGGNGKSTFLTTLLDLLGSYAEPSDVGLLLGRAQRPVGLFRLRALVVPEIPEGGRGFRRAWGLWDRDRLA